MKQLIDSVKVEAAAVVKTMADCYGITALRMDDLLHLKAVTVGGVIGVGAFGTVFRVEHDGKKYAAKRMKASVLAEKFTMRSLKDFYRKCGIFNLTSGESRAGGGAGKGSENIVKYIGIYQEDVNNMPLLVMELMHIELRYLLHAHKETLSYRDKVNICHDIASGLDFLHSREPEILHRNLHSNNILLDERLRAKISDLMNTRLIRPEDMLNKQITAIPGHVEYLPPEVFLNVQSYVASSDVFSSGVLIMEVFTHQPPRPLRNYKIPELQRRESDLLLLPEDTALVDIIHKCIKDRCSDRPSAKQLCDDLMAMKRSLKYGMSPTSITQQVSFSESLLDDNHQIKWEKCSEIPAGVSNATAVKDDKGVVYIGGGWVGDAETLSSIATYNPHTNYWSTLPSCPVQYGRLTTIAEKDGTKLIVVGGILEADWRTTDKLFTWKGGGKWKEQYPCMSVPRLTPAVSVYDNKYLIVAGGSGRDHSLDSIEVLELERMEWSRSKVKLPHPVTEAVGSIAGNNFIIMDHTQRDVIAGNDECSILSIPINAILGEAPVTITTLPPAPIPHSTLLQNMDPPLLLGGCSNTTELPGIFVYCNDTNNWKQVGNTSCNRANATGILLHSNAILLLGGVYQSNLSKEMAIHSVEVGYI